MAFNQGLASLIMQNPEHYGKYDFSNFAPGSIGTDPSFLDTIKNVGGSAMNGLAGLFQRPTIQPGQVQGTAPIMDYAGLGLAGLGAYQNYTTNKIQNDIAKQNRNIQTYNFNKKKESDAEWEDAAERNRKRNERIGGLAYRGA